MWDGENWHGTPGNLLATDTASPDMGDRGQAETVPVAGDHGRPCNACVHIGTEGRSVFCSWVHKMIYDTHRPPCDGECFTEAYRWVVTLKTPAHHPCKAYGGNDVD